MVGIFKANNPFNTFSLIIYGLILKLPWFLHPAIPVPQKSDDFLFIQILSKLKIIGDHFHGIYPLITYLLLLTQAVTFNRLFNNQRLMQRPNYLPAMSYLLITSMFAEWNVLSATLLINTLLIWIWARISNLYKTHNPKTTLFNTGMVVSLSAFLYFPSIAFSILILFALRLTRPFKITEWIITFLGILTPYYFLYSYLFLSDSLAGYKLPAISIVRPVFHQSYWLFAAILILLTALVMACYFLRKDFREQQVQVRKGWILIIGFLIVAFLIPFLNIAYTFEYWILCALPLSALIGYAFFYPEKKWMPLVLHWLMAACAIVISYSQ